MFCKECGNKVEDTAKFCSKCGASTSEKGVKTASVDLKTPVVTAKPVFIPWITIASVLPIQLFITVWAGGLLGGLGLLGVNALGLNLPIWSTFVFFGALVFFGIPFLAYYAKKKTYAKTEYKFYPDRLEYAEGFWTVENKTIKYKNITETNLRRGILQKKYGIGSIIFSTPSTGTQQGSARSGIIISDIENTEKIYSKVLELIG